MDETDSEQNLNTKSPGVQLEQSPLHYPFTTTTTSTRQDTNLPVTADKYQGERTPDEEDNTDFQMQEEEAAVEKAIATASPSLASGDDASPVDSNYPDVKIEGAEDCHMLQPMIPTHTSPARLRADHLDLIYEIDGTKMFCRLCVYVLFIMTISQFCLHPCR
jgi:hypothetical protein